MRIGSDEHKELFCRSFIETHKVFEPEGLAWPELDEISLARLRAVPIWSLALEVELGAGGMLAGFARGEPDALVRRALELQGYEEERHGRVLQYLVSLYDLPASPQVPASSPSRKAFVDFGYNECVDSFAGFGIFRLARETRIVPESLTSVFSQIIWEEARHIVFFVNWIAWDRARSGLGSRVQQAIPALLGYIGAVLRRVAAGSEMKARQNGPPPAPGLFDDALRELTPAKFVRACIEENDRYMRAFDRRLLRPRVIPSLAKLALPVLDLVQGKPSSVPQAGGGSLSMR